MVAVHLIRARGLLPTRTASLVLGVRRDRCPAWASERLATGLGPAAVAAAAAAALALAGSQSSSGSEARRANCPAAVQNGVRVHRPFGVTVCCSSWFGSRCHRPVALKTEGQRALIKQVVETSSVFKYIGKDKLEQVVDAFQGPVAVPAGTVVIKQGHSVTKGDPCLFMIESGSVGVFAVKDHDARSGVDHRGSHVCTFDKPGQSFGHLAMLYDVRRTASVVATRETVLWTIDRESFQLAIDCESTANIVAKHAVTVAKAGVHPQNVAESFAIFDVNLTDAGEREENLPKYWKICKENVGLMCTLSCFAPWNKDKKRNGSAKVIPAVKSTSEEAVRVFLFDDNIEWEGKATSPGIVNLRDAVHAKFVDFGEGANGFSRDQFATNTVIHHSSQYRNVLVQANILDAMEDEEYFSKIISKYSKPGEKCVIFMDINSTIMSADSVSCKDMSQMVLGTMFEFITMTPLKEFDYQWEDGSCKPVKVKKEMHLKKFVKEICKDDKQRYDTFYTYENCGKVLASLAGKVKLRWAQQEDEFGPSKFKELYDRYLVSLAGGTNQDGITKSWFQCFETQSAAGHSVVLNTFGMDSRLIIWKTVDDERQVLQMSISFNDWDDRDKAAFNKIYGKWS